MMHIDSLNEFNLMHNNRLDELQISPYNFFSPIYSFYIKHDQLVFLIKINQCTFSMNSMK